MRLKRRTMLSGLVGLSLPFIAAGCNNSAPESTSASSSASPEAASSSAGSGSSAATTARIGYQRFTDLDLIRTRGQLDQSLQQLGATAEWSFFQAGPPMLEAMNAGSLDFGGVGEAPPIFAQAAGAQFYYIASTPRGPETQDIVVPSNSAIQSPADLRGKKVALQRGSSAHYLLLQVLQEANVPVNEVEVVSLPPADARAAFEQGTVDAWSIWDPFLAVVESTGNIRNLKVGRDRRAFFLASQEFANNSPDLVKAILEAAKENEEWGKAHAKEIAEQFSGELQIDASILQIVNERRQWGLLPFDEETKAGQQKVADTFYDLKIIPKSIDVNQVVLPNDQYTKLFPS